MKFNSNLFYLHFNCLVSINAPNHELIGVLSILFMFEMDLFISQFFLISAV